MIDHRNPVQVTVLFLAMAAVLAGKDRGIAQHQPEPKSAVGSEISSGLGLANFLRLSLERNPG